MKKILALAITLLVFSYPIVTSWVLFFGYDTSAANAATKALIAGLFLFVIVFGRTKNLNSLIAAAPLIIFFLFYAIRLLYDVMLLDVIYFGQSKFYTLAYFFGLTLLPVLAIAINIKKEDAPLLSQWLFVGAILANASILLYVQNAGVLGTADAFSGRFEVKGDLEGTTVLNPIMIGLMGAILVAFTIGRLGTLALATPWQQAFHGALIVAGGSNILIGASRGPALALGVALLLTLFLLVRGGAVARGGRLKGKLWVYGGVMAAGLMYLVITRSDTMFLFERFASMFDPDMGRTIELRDVIYAQAWQNFLEAPVFGYSYMTVDGYSPHNIFLEALMATGVVGSFFLIPTMYAAVLGGWRLLLGRSGREGVPIALVGACLFIVGLTSGSVGQFPEFWVFLTIVMTLGAKARAPRRRREGGFLRDADLRGVSS